MKKYTQQEILDCIKKIADLVNEGDSIQIATKKITKNSGNVLARKVRKHPLYVHILNDYMKKKRVPHKVLPQRRTPSGY